MKIRNILLVTPIIPCQEGTFDQIVYNTYIPLKMLGYNVEIYDPYRTDLKIEEFITKNSFKPDLIYCCLIDTNIECWDYIKNCTQSENIITFNLFCDDTWRFKDFSSKVCFELNAVSTPEPDKVEEYKKLGYNNVINLPWFCSSDFYSFFTKLEKKEFDICSFARYINHERKFMYTAAREITTPDKLKMEVGAPYDSMIYTMCRSKITLNSSVDTQKNTQMKLRMFEAPACNSLLLTSDHKGLHEFFEVDKDYVVFGSVGEMVSKAKWLLQHDGKRTYISNNAHRKFLKYYESKVVLGYLIPWLESVK